MKLYLAICLGLLQTTAEKNDDPKTSLGNGFYKNETFDEALTDQTILFGNGTLYSMNLNGTDAPLNLTEVLKVK